MKNILFCFIVLIISANGKSQDAKIDSLKNCIALYNQKKNRSLNDDTLAVLTYLEIASVYRKNKSDSAFYFANNAHEIAANTKWLAGQALSTLEIAYYYYFVVRDFSISLSYLDSAQNIWKLYLPKTPDALTTCLLIARTGTCYYELGDYDMAIPYYNQSLEIAKKNGLTNEYILTHNSLGLTYSKMGNDSMAIAIYKEGLLASKAINDSGKVYILLGNIGINYFRSGNYALALDYLKQAYEGDKSLNNLSGQMRHLQNMSDVYQRQGEYEKALQIQNQISEKYTEYNYGYGVSMSLNSKAQIYLLMGDYENALINGLEALKWARDIASSKMTSSCLTTLGVIAHFMGNYPAAMDYYNQSHEIDISIGNSNANNAYLVNVANVYFQLGLYEKALSYHEEVLKVAQLNGDRYLEATTLGNIGSLYVKLKKFDLALTYNNLALEIADDNNLKALSANTLTSIAQIYFIQKDYISSEQYYQKSLEVSKSIDAQVSISSCYSALCEIQIIWRNYTAAVSAGYEGLKYATLTKNPDNLSDALAAIYRALIKNNEPDLALIRLSELRQHIIKNLEINFFSLSEKEREAYFTTIESNLNPYYDFGLFYQNKYPEITDTLYNLALSTKGLSLKSSTFLRQSILASEDSILIADYNQLLKLRKEIATTVDAETTEQEELANTLEKNIVKRSGAFSDFEKIKSIDWKQIRATLEPNECAIEFVNFESYIDSTNPRIYGALLVRPDSEHPDFIRLCTEVDLIEIIGALQGNNLNFVNAVYGTKDKAQTALYQKVWQPIEPYLKGATTIYYSPSGLLHKISIASLCKSENVFLADLYNLRQMGSTSNIALESEISFGALENFLLMGGVNFNSLSTQTEAWSYLPGSLNETNAIYTALQKKKFGINYFTGDNASEEVFKEKITSSSIVHIATHGFFFPDPEQVRAELLDDIENNSELIFRGNNINNQQGTTNYANWTFVNNQNPLMRSGIVLAGANDVWSRKTQETGEDGILTAAEVSNLDLRNTKLVVLSACETGLGDIKGSEGVYGLQRAFKMAGVRYIIMSLWQVPDKETSEFMILFYKNLIKIKDFPMAFQKTQKVMREKYDPYYWGAFVLIE